MKTEIIKQINVKFEKDEKESIRKAIAVIGNLLNIGDKNNCSCYQINDFYRENGDFVDLIDFLQGLACADIIELT